MSRKRTPTADPKQRSEARYGRRHKPRTSSDLSPFHQQADHARRYDASERVTGRIACRPARTGRATQVCRRLRPARHSVFSVPSGCFLSPAQIETSSAANHSSTSISARRYCRSRSRRCSNTRRSQNLRSYTKRRPLTLPSRRSIPSPMTMCASSRQACGRDVPLAYATKSIEPCRRGNGGSGVHRRDPMTRSPPGSPLALPVAKYRPEFAHMCASALQQANGDGIVMRNPKIKPKPPRKPSGSVSSTDCQQTSDMKSMKKSALKLVPPNHKVQTVAPDMARRRPNAELRAREYLTEAEVEKLCEAARGNRWGHRDATMILVAFRHGLRVAELIDLRWDQVELESARLHVRRAKNGTPSVHPIHGDELRALRRLQA